MIKCLVVDDEPLAREAVKTHIAKMPDLALIGECENTLQAMVLLRKESIDLIFLDIEMPEIDGISFLKRRKINPGVIFTTAYRNYAVEAFELDVIDYLLKPISFDRFVMAINKFYERKNNPVCHNEIINDNQSFINVKANRKTYKIDVLKIDYIESLKDYVKVVCADETIITHDSLSNMEDILKKFGFIRIHNSFLVATSKIKSFNSESVFLEEKELPISRTYKKYVLSHLEK
ncbi:MAG: LytTR family DNA-binding domain-containing protein [Bacteroidales bacterium]|nr:LytTR family DNA-binding domain-containing protein [Bacteroidales bacterium]MCF8328496.1 LytTR family DNA-binding domain-containing protein [Bacteroidales bacterium]